MVIYSQATTNNEARDEIVKFLVREAENANRLAQTGGSTQRKMKAAAASALREAADTVARISFEAKPVDVRKPLRLDPSRRDATGFPMVEGAKLPPHNQDGAVTGRLTRSTADIMAEEAQTPAYRFAYDRGRNAREVENLAFHECPHDPNSIAARGWRQGWNDAAMGADR